MNKEYPLVSVIIACYNHEKYVQESIQSVIDQDYENIELIVIDDGSFDNSVKKIEEIIPVCEERFERFEFRTRTNKGLCATLNEAISWTEGYFLSTVASDDILFSNRYSRQVAEFNNKIKINNKLVAIYSGVKLIDDLGSEIKIKYGSGRFSGFKEVVFRKEFLPTPTMMVLKEKVLEVGCFNSNFRVEDFYMKLKLTNYGGFFYTMPDVLVYYRRHADNMSKKNNYIWAGVKETLDEYKGQKFYRKALAMSMMVQAHSYQTVSKTKGIKWVLKAIRTHLSVIFTTSMIKFIIKCFL